VKVLIVGAGRMGSQIGCEYALGGHTVDFLAPHPEPARERVRAALDLAHHVGVPGDYGRTVAAMAVSDQPGEEYDLMVESVPEDMELKVNVLRPLAAANPSAIVASNTSSLSVTELGRAIDASSRTLGTHYWDPPLLMRPVELVATERTDPAVVGRMAVVLGELGKRPVTVNRDVPGFAWNRLQAAILREALWIVENGVATAEAVDLIIREGLARRWRHVGPFETVGIGGIATWRRIGENVLPALSTATVFNGLEEWLPTDAEALAAARARRDAALAAEMIAEAQDAVPVRAPV